MQKLRLSHREKKIFIFCLFVIFTYIGYQFVFVAAVREEAFLQDRISALNRQIVRDLRILEKEPEVKSLYEAYLGNLKQKGTDMQEMASILSDIESVAKALNLRIEDMKPRRIRSQEIYSHFPVSVRVRASLDLVVRFLYDLQAPPYVFYVEELRLEKPSIRQTEILCEIIVSRLLIKE